MDMMKWGTLTNRIEKTNCVECKNMILTLASLSEITACNGYGILEIIYRGTFDEADLHSEEIPESYRTRVKLDFIRNDFFGDLIVTFQIVEDYDYACQLVENHILHAQCSEEEYRNMVFQYLSMRMICKQCLPWEIEYCLGSIVYQGISLVKTMRNYMNEKDTYADCVKRFRGHWQRA